MKGRVKIAYANEKGHLEAFCKNGVLQGFYRKYDDKKRLTHFGTFLDGRPYGVNWQLVNDGGIVVGVVDDDGELSGEDIVFLYPDMKTAFMGLFCKGHLVQAQSTTLEYVHQDQGLLVPFFNDPAGPIYRRDISNFETVTQDPLLPDPYESSIVDVRPSRVEGANDGLFAKRDVTPGTILAFYNGIRRQPKSGFTKADWVASGYRIEDPTRKKGSLDIPEEYRNLKNYCATLAHKTNHSFLPSAEFEDFVHPRFGLIPCVTASQCIKKDEEIFIHYGYTLNHCPDWYEAAYANEQYPVPEYFKDWQDAVKTKIESPPS